MPIRQLNPQEFALLKRREQAEIIAREKRKLKPDYKLKSAYRYLQRATAPEGKQRIKQPRLEAFLPPKLARQVDRTIKIQREIRSRPPKPPPLTWEYFVERGARPVELPEGSTADKIAILISQLEYDRAAEALDVDETLLDKVVGGTQLNRLERYEIEEQLSHLMRDEELQSEYDVDVDFIEKNASHLTDTIRLKNVDDQNIIRGGIADGDIDLDKFTRAISLFRDLNNSQLGRILDAYADQKKGIPIYHVKRDKKTGLIQMTKRKVRQFDINEMFDAAELDDYHIMDVEESEFWAWFRELFY